MDEEEMMARLNELISEWVHIEYQDGAFGVVWSNRAALREATSIAEELEARKQSPSM
jgi:hypothetical protein